MASEFLKPSKAVKAHTIGNKQNYAQALPLFKQNNRHLQVAAHPFDQQITLRVFGSITSAQCYLEARRFNSSWLLSDFCSVSLQHICYLHHRIK